MNWLLLYEIGYTIVVILVCLRIIYETRTNTKTLAYVLLVIFLPLAGIFIYFSFGTNYRKRKIYSKKLFTDEKLADQLKERIIQYSRETYAGIGPAFEQSRELAMLLVKDNNSPLTSGNNVQILVNGETKFPHVLQALQEAKHHIHIEYYIYEDDEIGRAIEQLLIKKVKEGVTVRFIYDDFGSRSIRKKLVSRLRSAGVQAFPFYRVLFWAFANRLNYRNHRKIIVVDGATGFVGGINVSDRYINKEGANNKLFWRDTHLQIEGPGVLYLQYLFFCDWNFCAQAHLQHDNLYFPSPFHAQAKGNKIVQIAASGPDSDVPTILFSLLQAISLATKEILITTPYFIPGESIVDALMVASLGGVTVKLLAPGQSDSVLVNTAAHSYYDDLLTAGVEIYLYTKGFVHAKTMVVDRKTSIIGTANMDYRSLDLNFEVNAIVYDEETGVALSNIFYEDLQHAERIDPEQWRNRSWHIQLLEKTARLVSPLL